MGRGLRAQSRNRAGTLGVAGWLSLFSLFQMNGGRGNNAKPRLSPQSRETDMEVGV